jgi:hypothetical protein
VPSAVTQTWPRFGPALRRFGHRGHPLLGYVVALGCDFVRLDPSRRASAGWVVAVGDGRTMCMHGWRKRDEVNMMYMELTRREFPHMYALFHPSRG